MNYTNNLMEKEPFYKMMYYIWNTGQYIFYPDNGHCPKVFPQ